MVKHPLAVSGEAGISTGLAHHWAICRTMEVSYNQGIRNFM
jgi:hypothetical protein